MNIEKSSKILGDINYEMMAIKNNFYLNGQKELDTNSLINYKFYPTTFKINIKNYLTLSCLVWVLDPCICFLLMI